MGEDPMDDIAGSETVVSRIEPAAPGRPAGTRADERVDPDAVIDRLSVRQHGIVGRRQLLVAGVPQHVVDYRVGKRRLHPVYPGVYRLGPVRARFSREMAAVLACGDGAVVSHGSAATLWGLRPDPGPGRAPARERRGGGGGRAQIVDVSIRHGCRSPGPGVRVHRIATLESAEITTTHGIPVTAPPRTILDVGAYCGVRELERMVATAERRGLASRRQIAALVARFPRRRGTRALRSLLAQEAGAGFVRSEAESLLQALVRKAGLESPRTNVVVHGYEVDSLWPQARLVVEIDGFAFHSSRAAFERDRDRDSALTGAGYRVIRVTWRQLKAAPEVFLVRLAQALARRGR